MTIDINTIIDWNLEQLYNYIKTIEEDLTKEELETLVYCEVGKYRVPTHINYYIKNYVTEYPSSKKAKVLGLGKIDLEEYWADLQKRETKLRQIIINHIEDDSPTEGRV